MRVLVVEDNKKTAAFISKALKSEGFAVNVLADGDEALLTIASTPFRALADRPARGAGPSATEPSAARGTLATHDTTSEANRVASEESVAARPMVLDAHPTSAKRPRAAPSVPSLTRPSRERARSMSRQT